MEYIKSCREYDLVTYRVSIINAKLFVNYMLYTTFYARPPINVSSDFNSPHLLFGSLILQNNRVKMTLYYVYIGFPR